jgi:hypothetical protein
MKVEGGCYCGAVRFEAEGDPLMAVQCHCRECQHISGGGPNYTMAMPEAGFKYTKGAPKQFTRSDLDNPVTRDFCGDCGAPLLTRVPAFAGALFLKAGAFDDPKQFGMPQAAIFCTDKQPFHAVPAGVAEFDGMPPS